MRLVREFYSLGFCFTHDTQHRYEIRKGMMRKGTKRGNNGGRNKKKR
jgi:hypothetical protein